MLTQERLKELLSYDPETGIFTWLESRGNAKLMRAAGTTDKCGYIIIMVDRKNYKAHRLAFLFIDGKYPVNEVDHIDHDKSNNSWRNIRPATKDQNSRSQPLRADNKSGYAGVHWVERSASWRSTVRISGVSHHLGYFKCPHKAGIAAKEYRTTNGFHENHGL